MRVVKRIKPDNTFLSEFGNEVKSTSLPGFLLDSLNKGVKNLDGNKKGSGNFYISELGYCLRQTYFKKLYPFDKPPALLMKFAAGTDSGVRVVKFLQSAQVLFGSAYCACGEHVTSCVVPDSCSECGKRMYYSELGITDLTRKISGKVDSMIYFKGRAYLVESKSSSTYYKLHDRKSILKHLGHNIHQGNMYLGLIRAYARQLEKKEVVNKIIFFDSDLGTVLDGLSIYPRMSLDSFVMLYEDRNTNVFNPHVFNYDHEMYKSDIKRVRLFFAHKETQTPPPKEGTSCKFCDYMDRCREVGP